MSDKKKKQRLTENPNKLLEEKTKLKIRNVYEHTTCGTLTEIPLELAETFAAKPHLHSVTYCATCKKYRPVSEFFWHPDKIKVGS
jgi:hypothetical protein